MQAAQLVDTDQDSKEVLGELPGGYVRPRIAKLDCRGEKYVALCSKGRVFDLLHKPESILSVSPPRLSLIKELLSQVAVDLCLTSDNLVVLAEPISKGGDLQTQTQSAPILEAARQRALKLEKATLDLYLRETNRQKKADERQERQRIENLEMANRLSANGLELHPDLMGGAKSNKQTGLSAHSLLTMSRGADGKSKARTTDLRAIKGFGSLASDSNTSMISGFGMANNRSSIINASARTPKSLSFGEFESGQGYQIKHSLIDKYKFKKLRQKDLLKDVGIQGESMDILREKNITMDTNSIQEEIVKINSKIIQEGISVHGGNWNELKKRLSKMNDPGSVIAASMSAEVVPAELFSSNTKPCPLLKDPDHFPEAPAPVTSSILRSINPRKVWIELTKDGREKEVINTVFKSLLDKEKSSDYSKLKLLSGRSLPVLKNTLNPDEKPIDVSVISQMGDSARANLSELSVLKTEIQHDISVCQSMKSIVGSFNPESNPPT